MHIKDPEKTIKTAARRIQNAIALDQYATYVRSKYQSAPAVVNPATVDAILEKGLLHQLREKRVISGDAIIANMLSIRRWGAFKELSNVKAGELHEVAELNLSALVLLNQEVASFSV